MSMTLTIPSGKPAVIRSGTQLLKTPEWKTVGLGVTIVRRESPEGVAPHSVWFEAQLTGSNLSLRGQDGNVVFDPHWHDYLYTWDFGDHGAYTIADLRDPVPAINAALGVNLPLWMDRSVADGKMVNHVFGTPGNYTVQLTVHNRAGVVGVASVEIPVADPDVMFSGNKTIVVSNTGSFTGAPAGAQQVASIAAAFTAVKALGVKGRILLKRGEDYTAEGQPRISGSGWLNCYIGAWGSGVVAPRVAGIWAMNAGGGGIITRDIEFWDDYDDETEQGGWGSEQYYALSASGHHTVYRVKFKGGKIAIYPRECSEDFALSVFDCNLNRFGNFGTLMVTQGRVGFSGVSIKRSPLALGWGNGKLDGDDGNWHGCMRWSAEKGKRSIGVFRQLDLFNNAGWSTVSNAQLGKMPGHQACFRTSGGDPEHYLSFNRVIAEGGLNQIVLTDTAAGAERLPTNSYFDKLLLIGSPATVSNLPVCLSGSSVRNVVVIQPDSRIMHSGGWGQAFGGSDKAFPDDPLNALEPILAYSNSFVSRLNVHPDPGKPELAKLTTFQKVVMGNNVEHAPNHTAPINGGDFDDTVVFAPIFLSHQWRGIPPGPIIGPDTSFNTPADTIRLPIPTTGNPNIGAAEVGKPVAVDDFFGRIRPLEGASKGAIEPFA